LSTGERRKTRNTIFWVLEGQEGPEQGTQLDKATRAIDLAKIQGYRRRWGAHGTKFAINPG